MTHHRTTYKNPRNLHGLYTFCWGVIIGVALVVGIVACWWKVTH